MLLVVLVLMLFMMVLSSSLIYLFESEQYEAVGDVTGLTAFNSIPAGPRALLFYFLRSRVKFEGRGLAAQI